MLTAGPGIPYFRRERSSVASASSCASGDFGAPAAELTAERASQGAGSAGVARDRDVCVGGGGSCRASGSSASAGLYTLIRARATADLPSIRPLGVIQLGRLGDVTAAPDDQGVSALDVGALEVGIGVPALYRCAPRRSSASGRPLSHISQPSPGSARPSWGATHPCVSRPSLGPLERELVPVPRRRVVGDLRGPARPGHSQCAAAATTGTPGSSSSMPGLIRGGHPRRQQLDAASEPVSELFD